MVADSKERKLTSQSPSITVEFSVEDQLRITICVSDFVSSEYKIYLKQTFKKTFHNEVSTGILLCGAF